MSNAYRTVPEIRYDLDADTCRLDLDSHQALIERALKWSDRNAELAAEVLDLEPFEEPGEWRCLIQPVAPKPYSYATTISIRKAR